MNWKEFKDAWKVDIESERGWIPMVASALIGAGASIYNSKKSLDATQGGGMATQPQYSFTEPRLKLASDFASGALQNMSEGKYPQYYQNAMPELRAGMQRNLKESFYGSPMGGPGVMGGIREAGAATGLGPSQVTAQTNKAMLEYSNKEKEIDEYLTSLGVGIMQRDATQFTQLASQMPQGPGSQMMPGYATGAQPTDYSGLNAIASNLPDFTRNQGTPSDINLPNTELWGNQSPMMTMPNTGITNYGGSMNTPTGMVMPQQNFTPNYSDYNFNPGGYTGTGYGY